MHAQRKADCPNCGGPIEFKLGSSLTCVCNYCRFSVVRTELAVEAIGKLAQLVPTAPIMSVGDRGKIEGRRFVVGGRLQLDHGAGPWDEWYIEYEDGSWGWLAKAQGKMHTTRPLPAEALPAWDALQIGAVVNLPGTDTNFTVAERGGSAVVSAEGELPVPVHPQASGRYVDLSGPGGVFATIDYGDGTQPPELFVGRSFDSDALEIEGRRLGPAPTEKVEAARLRCPTCGAPVPITTPETTERAACGSCRSLLDFEQGNLRFLERLEQPELYPRIPLASTGVILGEEVTVIGFMHRSCPAGYERYAWGEYLVHTRYGYRWLLEADGHYTYLRPIGAGDVQSSISSSMFRGRRYRAFSTGTARVDAVVGEFYWRVAQGDESETADFVAPPRMLSRETTPSEVQWTAGEYVEARTLWESLEVPGEPPAQRGIAPAQPNPHDFKGLMRIAGGLLLALAVVAMFLPGTRDPALAETVLEVPARPGEAATDAEAVTLTEPFDLVRDTTTLQLELETDLANQWIAVATALINEDTGEVREFFLQTEEWHGPDYREGSRDETEYLDRLKAGTYSLRFDTRWGGQGSGSRTAPRAMVRATEGGRSAFTCVVAGLLLLLPALLAMFRHGIFEGQRWKDSDMMSDLQSSLEGD